MIIDNQNRFNKCMITTDDDTDNIKSEMNDNEKL